jgi:hypothetical protein
LIPTTAIRKRLESLEARNEPGTILGKKWARNHKRLEPLEAGKRLESLETRVICEITVDRRDSNLSACDTKHRLRKISDYQPRQECLLSCLTYVSWVRCSNGSIWSQAQQLVSSIFIIYLYLLLLVLRINIQLVFTRFIAIFFFENAKYYI